MTLIFDSRAVGIVVLLLLIFGGRVFGDSAGATFSPSVMTSGRHNAWEDQAVVVSLVNGHAHAVRLVSLRSSCGCLRVETLPQDDLLPANGAVAIKAYVRGGTKTGSYTLYLFAEWQTANGDANGMTRLSIRGEAVPPLMVTSGGKQNLGTIPVGQTARCRITLRGGLVPVVLREPETASDMTLAMPKRRLAADEVMVVELMLTPQKTGAFQRTVLFGLEEPAGQSPVAVTLAGWAEQADGAMIP